MRVSGISKSHQVAEHLRAEVAAGSPGARLPTEASLAKRFGVSVNTLREALSVLAREGLIDRRHGCGTFIVSPRPAQHVALWYGLELSHPHSGAPQQTLSLIQQELFERGVAAKAYLATGANREFSGDLVCEEFIRDVEAHRVCALGLVTGALVPTAWAAVTRQRIPVVGPQSTVSTPTVTVEVNHARLTQCGVNRLRALGCRQLAWLTWLDARAEAKTRSRRTDFEDALRAAGLPCEPRWIAGNLHPSQPGAGYELLREIWSARAEKPDGLLVGDDMYLPDLVSAVLELRIAVPNQLKIVSLANRSITTCPFFPTDRLEVDLVEHARIIAELLARLSRREPVTERAVELPFQLLESEVVTERARRAVETATSTNG
jgi:DNA-binding LacI/PurR family transcriptional regulator